MYSFVNWGERKPRDERGEDGTARIDRQRAKRSAVGQNVGLVETGENRMPRPSVRRAHPAYVAPEAVRRIRASIRRWLCSDAIHPGATLVEPFTVLVMPNNRSRGGPDRWAPNTSASA